MHKIEGIKPYIIQCMVMRLSQKESIEYLKDKGFEISNMSLYRYRKEITDSRFQRLSFIAKSQFVDQHLERIDQLELINQEMWSLYRKETNTFKQVLILEKIAELQTYISPYYDASMYVMQNSIKSKIESESNEQTKEDNSLSSV
jgi:hypothetical protein